MRRKRSIGKVKSLGCVQVLVALETLERIQRRKVTRSLRCESGEEGGGSSFSRTRDAGTHPTEEGKSLVALSKTGTRGRMFVHPKSLFMENIRLRECDHDIADVQWRPSCQL